MYYSHKVPVASAHWLGAVVLATACVGPAPPILDGRFDEWTRSALIVQDAADTSPAAIDLLWVRGLDDPYWLYLALDLGRESNIQSLPGTLSLLIDADNNNDTGGTQHSMDGVDLVLELSQTRDPFVEGRGSGFSLRAVGADGLLGDPVRHVRGVTSAPSWASRQHELRLARTGDVGLPTLGAEAQIKAVYDVQGSVVDETPSGVYIFQTAVDERIQASLEDKLAKAAGSIRVAQWNVSSQSFLNAPGDFARMLAAVQPDVVLLDEIFGSVTNEDAALFFAEPPLAELGDWNFVLGESGGRQRTMVGARGREIRPAESMREVRYTPEVLEAFQETVPPWFQEMLSLEAERQISATGAWVGVGSGEVLFVPLDLQSAGWSGSPQDRLRVIQAQAIRNHVHSEAGVGDWVVLGGDLNLVGSDEPLQALIRGLDRDGSDLSPVDALRLGERTYATWRDSLGLFAPGRLDFLLVPDVQTTITNSFVFTTEDLDDEALAHLGLEPDLSARLSDHLIVTADLRFASSY